MKRAAKKPAARKSVKRSVKKAAVKRPARKQRAVEKPAARRSVGKSAAKKPAAHSSSRPKRSVKKAASPARRRTAKSAPARRESAVAGARRGLRSFEPPAVGEIWTGAETGGQSGDIEGLPHRSSADSQSVAELLEEGQSFEAGVISGVEDAPNADESEVTTREVPEDDVPPEYLER